MAAFDTFYFDRRGDKTHGHQLRMELDRACVLQLVDGLMKMLLSNADVAHVDLHGTVSDIDGRPLGQVGEKP